MNRGMWLGFLFFVALVILGFATLLIKNVNFLGHPQTLNIHFERAQGLRPGSDVRVDGILFGRVEDVQLHPQSGVRVKIKVNEPVTLYQDAEILVESSSVLGGNIISIRRGSKPPALILTEELAGKSRGGLEEVGDLATDNRENLRQLIANLKDLSQSLKDGQGTVGKLLKSDELHKEAVDTLKTARETVTEAKAEIKKVGDNLTDLTKKVSDKLDKAEGPLGAALNDKKMTEKIDRILSNVEDTSKNLKDITENVKKNEGALGRMINDKEMGDKLKSTIDNVERTSESLKNIGTKLEAGEGTVGKILQDEELYESAKQTLSDVDKFFARASRSVVEFVTDYQNFHETKSSSTHIGIRIGPDEDKYFQAGAAFLSFDKTGKKIAFEKQADNENQSIFKAEILLAYRAPWLFDRHVGVRGGIIEGKPGGGVDIDWSDWGFFSYPVRFTFEARDAYNSVEREDIDENIRGPLMRSYVRVPLWVRKDNWFESLLSLVRVYAGVNRLAKDNEFMGGVSIDWPDEDIRTLVGLIGTAR